MRKPPTSSSLSLVRLGETVKNKVGRLCVFLIAASISLAAPAHSQEIIYVDTCSSVRDFFREMRPFYFEERQKRISGLYEINRQLESRPDPSLVRQIAARESRAIAMDLLEQVAAMGWPTARDRTLRNLLVDISEGKQVRNKTLALGRYCRAGTFIGLNGT